MDFSEIQIGHTKQLLALLQCPGIGGQTALRLTLPRVHNSQSLNRLISPRLSRPLNEKERVLRSDLLRGELISSCLEAWVDQQCQWHLNHQAKVIGFYDENYPLLLRLIPNPPAVLFVRGKLQDLQYPTVTVVGTRSPSKRGIIRAEACLKWLAEAGLGIISGLASGIDYLAHQSALKEGTYTVAILGHGLDTCYPSEHETLSQMIIDHGGALLSEYPAKTPISKANLVRRDRLQSALSSTTYIVESHANGGSLHAGRAAQKQGRSLWIPRSLKAQLSEFNTDLNPVIWLTNESHFKSQVHLVNKRHYSLIKDGERLKSTLIKLRLQTADRLFV